MALAPSLIGRAARLTRFFVASNNMREVKLRLITPRQRYRVMNGNLGGRGKIGGDQDIP
jgi:hypothetical protein